MGLVLPGDLQSRLSVILIPCESVVSVICKVKIPPQMTYHFSLNTKSCDNNSPVIWPAFGGSYIIFSMFLFLCAFLFIFRTEKDLRLSFEIIFWVLSYR